MSIRILLTWITGMTIAVAISVSITLTIYYLGYPIIALALSSPVGLIIGITAGLIIRRQLATLTMSRYSSGDGRTMERSELTPCKD